MTPNSISPNLITTLSTFIQTSGYWYDLAEQNYPHHPATALTYYQLAVQQGHSEARVRLAYLYLQAECSQQEQEKAYVLLESYVQTHLASIKASGCGDAVNPDNPIWKVFKVLDGILENDRLPLENQRTAIRLLQFLSKQSVNNYIRGQAFYLLGEAHNEGHGGPKNKQEAWNFYKEAADLGNGNGLAGLADLYEESNNPQEACKLYLKAMRLEQCASCWEESVLFSRSSVSEMAELIHRQKDLLLSPSNTTSKKKADALEVLRLIAESADFLKENNFDPSFAINVLNKIEQRDAETAKHYISLAEQGHVKSMKKLAKMYEFGLGVQKDEEKAKLCEWKAHAERGVPQAQFALGTSLMLGLGVPQNLKTGLKYLQQAAKQDPSAMRRMASIHLNGLMEGGEILVPKNQEKAVLWLFRSITTAIPGKSVYQQTQTAVLDLLSSTERCLHDENASFESKKNAVCLLESVCSYAFPQIILAKSRALLGDAHHHGWGVTPDAFEAIRQYHWCNFSHTPIQQGD